jgi:Fe-S-cluster containining protein
LKKIVADWKANAREDLNENKAFLSSIPKNKKIDSLVSNLHEEVFRKVDCLQCANCCKTTPALVTRPDAKRIAKHLSIPPKTFIRKYLLEDINGELMIARVPCTFLNEDHTCQIYDVRPQACREYPHTNQSGFSRRSKMNANNTIVCPAVYEIVNRLKEVNL